MTSPQKGKPKPIYTPEFFQKVLLTWKDVGFTSQATAHAMGVGRSTIQNQLFKAREWLKTEEGKFWAKAVSFEVEAPTLHVRNLTEQLREANLKIAQIERDNIRSNQVREYIFGLSKVQPEPPKWVNDRKKFPYHHGVPCLFLSDIHYSEIVDPKQIFNANKYNSAIAQERVMRVIDKSLGLVFDTLNKPQYPGVCFILGGDNINGMIHDELMVGADKPLMTQAIEIADLIHSCILKLATRFEHVFVVGVAGNHGRGTKKSWAKFYAETNLDWLVYQMIERFLQSMVLEGKVSFLTPPARDVTFRVAGRGFRLTHGDQFKGGDSIIGPLGPITRGDNKKRAMSLTLPTSDEEYDTLLVAHFHSLYMSPSLIINGSVKGYDEFSLSMNFKYAAPEQALFLVHEDYGINHYMPVLADEPIKKKSPWLNYRTVSEPPPKHVEWSK